MSDKCQKCWFSGHMLVLSMIASLVLCFVRVHLGIWKNVKRNSFYQTSEKACQAPVIDLGTESPLNLFIQCFKEKCDICVNPNDVAIFVKH